MFLGGTTEPQIVCSTCCTFSGGMQCATLALCMSGRVYVQVLPHAACLCCANILQRAHTRVGVAVSLCSAIV